ncbi:hypothetical protein [Lacticaseibacillus paracasei]|uniref:hypothetical protein n=1 Tax=Lacticaseibacillus paracasei TaxID=1597 RepID=UPI0021AAE0BA|nr:hypothetical protein [Lacticaseibacillus paracasei]MCT4395320.1 hypothetical protein [Lacticaseibacillus paracasei]
MKAVEAVAIYLSGVFSQIIVSLVQNWIKRRQQHSERIGEAFENIYGDWQEVLSFLGKVNDDFKYWEKWNDENLENPNYCDDNQIDESKPVMEQKYFQERFKDAATSFNKISKVINEVQLFLTDKQRSKVILAMDTIDSMLRDIDQLCFVYGQESSVDDEELPFNADKTKILRDADRVIKNKAKTGV